MTDHAWKQLERRIAKMFGGVRRGPDFGGKDGGKNDIIVDGWSIEVKLRSRPSWTVVKEAVAQAEKAAAMVCDVTMNGSGLPEYRNHRGLEIPIAIIKQKYMEDKDAIVAMRLETFRDWFVN